MAPARQPSGRGPTDQCAESGHAARGRPQTRPVGVFPDRRDGRGGRPRASRKALPDAVIAEFHAFEEKGSDVNLTADLLNDAWRGQFDSAVVISDDTDLVAPVRMVTEGLKRPVLAGSPVPVGCC